MLITSNRSVGEWDAVFGDPMVATAILDRLLHHSHVVIIRGASQGKGDDLTDGGQFFTSPWSGPLGADTIRRLI